MLNRKILLIGNPNVGKSTVFNCLCGLKQKTGNYAGVTVESRTGVCKRGDKELEITDLPGAYSIYPTSEDEVIFSQYLMDEKESYDGVIYVADALNLRRSSLLFKQVKDLGVPMVMLVNQIDLAKKRGLSFDFAKMEQLFGVKIIPTNAKKNEGIDEVKKVIFENEFKAQIQPVFEIPAEYKGWVSKIKTQLKKENSYEVWAFLASERYMGKIEEVGDVVKKIIPKRLQVQEITRRYQKIDAELSLFFFKQEQIRDIFTEKVDRILVHPFWGYIVFGTLLLLIFNSVYFLAAYPMEWIEAGFEYLKDIIEVNLSDGPLKSLITDGVITGVSSVIVFAPQIGILLYFLYLLEDFGYMARVVYLMDRFLRPFGLNGKSIVPLVSSTACAIPAIMSTRNIENMKERLLTILVTPFMTCSARLPIYSIIIGLVIPNKYFLGVLNYRALMLFMMYIIGFIMSLLASWVLKKVIKGNKKSYLILDLPIYKVPLFSYNFKLVLGKVWEFILGAGRVIFAISVILWVLAYFGPKQNESEWIAMEVEMKDSYLAIVGKGIEPIVSPLGYDWKMGVGVLTSFAAREAFVGTISTLYGLDVDVESDEGEQTLMEKMRNDVKPNGEKVFSFATGMSILMFYAFAMQCISTIAIVYKETRSLKWTLVQLFGMSGLAYIVSFLTYQILK